MDAANMLKPALARGEFRMLGATTDEEYERWILGDPALERRFQKIAVRELSPAETLEILRTRIPSLARHHHVVITDAAIRAAIELTDIWVPDRRRPDKAIDALDEACAHIQATATYSPRLEELIARRRAWGRRATSGTTAPRGTGDPQFDRIARDGFAVLERLGAQIEAAFAQQPQPVETFADAQPQSATQPSPAPTAPAEPTGAERATLDIELERQLLDEGIVIRGHDVARVVGLMIGRQVEWEE
jgi:ATP-dependent Clp protease ATP-binding subunit ClpA